jgi:hypothetical protein
MRQRVAFAVFSMCIGAVSAAGAQADCPVPSAQPYNHAKAQKPIKGCVDLNSLPQISAQIVAREPLAAPGKTPPQPPDADKTPYTGPSVGLTKLDPGVKPTPTVGYRWSLD